MSEEGAKAAPRHAQGIKGVPRDARRVCFELFLGLVHVLALLILLQSSLE